MKRAFTLAEVLITIGIIGIIVVILVPTISVINNKLYDNARKQIEAKLTTTMKVLNAKGILEPTTTTDKFVDILEKNLKVVKRCNKNDLDQCFTNNATLIKNASNTKEKINLLELKTGVSLGQGDNNSDNVGLILADGVTMILTYNLNCDVDQYNNDKPVDKCLRAIYDINGLGNPNTINQDIGLFNASLSKVSNACIEINGFCADLTNTSYTPILEAPFDGIPDEENGNSIAANQWAGAKSACAEKGMRLPTLSEFTQMWYTDGVNMPAGYYFTSEEIDERHIYTTQSYTQSPGELSYPKLTGSKSAKYNARCVK